MAITTKQRHKRRRATKAEIDEYFEPCSKKGRGMARKSLDLIEALHAIAELAQPITGRGVGYKLFTARMIPSMARARTCSGFIAC